MYRDCITCVSPVVNLILELTECENNNHSTKLSCVRVDVISTAGYVILMF